MCYIFNSIFITIFYIICFYKSCNSIINKLGKHIIVYLKQKLCWAPWAPKIVFGAFGAFRFKGGPGFRRLG